MPALRRLVLVALSICLAAQSVRPTSDNRATLRQPIKSITDYVNQWVRDAEKAAQDESDEERKKFAVEFYKGVDHISVDMKTEKAELELLALNELKSAQQLTISKYGEFNYNIKTAVSAISHLLLSLQKLLGYGDLLASLPANYRVPPYSRIALNAMDDARTYLRRAIVPNELAKGMPPFKTEQMRLMTSGANVDTLLINPIFLMKVIETVCSANKSNSGCQLLAGHIIKPYLEYHEKAFIARSAEEETKRSFKEQTASLVEVISRVISRDQKERSTDVLRDIRQLTPDMRNMDLVKYILLEYLPYDPEPLDYMSTITQWETIRVIKGAQLATTPKQEDEYRKMFAHLTKAFNALNLLGGVYQLKVNYLLNELDGRTLEPYFLDMEKFLVMLPEDVESTNFITPEMNSIIDGAKSIIEKKSIIDGANGPWDVISVMRPAIRSAHTVYESASKHDRLFAKSLAARFFYEYLQFYKLYVEYEEAPFKTYQIKSITEIKKTCKLLTRLYFYYADRKFLSLTTSRLNLLKLTTSWESSSIESALLRSYVRNELHPQFDRPPTILEPYTRLLVKLIVDLRGTKNKEILNGFGPMLYKALELAIESYQVLHMAYDAPAIKPDNLKEYSELQDDMHLLMSVSSKKELREALGNTIYRKQLEYYSDDSDDEDDTDDELDQDATTPLRFFAWENEVDNNDLTGDDSLTADDSESDDESEITLYDSSSKAKDASYFIRVSGKGEIRDDMSDALTSQFSPPRARQLKRPRAIKKPTLAFKSTLLNNILRTIYWKHKDEYSWLQVVRGLIMSFPIASFQRQRKDVLLPRFFKLFLKSQLLLVHLATDPRFSYQFEPAIKKTTAVYLKDWLFSPSVLNALLQAMNPESNPVIDAEPQVEDVFNGFVPYMP